MKQPYTLRMSAAVVALGAALVFTGFLRAPSSASATVTPQDTPTPMASESPMPESTEMPGATPMPEATMMPGATPMPGATMMPGSNTPAPEQAAPGNGSTAPTTQMNALTSNPNGSDWLAKFNRHPAPMNMSHHMMMRHRMMHHRMMRHPMMHPKIMRRPMMPKPTPTPK